VALLARWVQRHLSYWGMTCFVPVIRLIHRHISKNNYPRSDTEHNPTIAIIELISSFRPTECLCMLLMMQEVGVSKIFVFSQ